jgi:hypothetical protein
MKHIIKIIFIMVAAAGLNLSAKAQGTLIWNWTWTGTATSGGGTLITTNVASTSTAKPGTPFTDSFIGYLALSMAGTIDGEAIAGLGAPGSFPGTAGDNLVSDGSQPLNFPYGGLTFSTSSQQFLIFYTAGPNPYTLTPNGGGDAGIFTVTLVSVPEPSILVLTALGGLTSCYFFRRKK